MGVVIVVAGVAASCRASSLDLLPGKLDGQATTADSHVIAGGASDSNGGSVPIACDVPDQTASAWTQIGVPNTLSGLQVTDVWAAGPDDLLFAGIITAKGTQGRTAEILHWRRGCWSLELSWPSIPDGSFPSLSGTGGDDIWVTAGDVLLHRDGTGWNRSENELQRLLIQQHPGTALRLQMVRAATPNNAWVIGPRNAWQHAAGQWRMFDLVDADFSGPDFVSAGQQSGAFWFTTLWVGSDNNVAIGGALERSGRLPHVAFVYRYDGASWTLKRVSEGDVEALWGDSSGGLWIGAFNGGRNSAVLHLHEGVVESVSVTGWPQADEALKLWGTAANDLWASGAGVLGHWDGQSWKAFPPPSGNSGHLPLLLAGMAGTVWLVRAGEPAAYFRLGH